MTPVFPGDKYAVLTTRLFVLHWMGGFTAAKDAAFFAAPSRQCFEAPSEEPYRSLRIVRREAEVSPGSICTKNACHSFGFFDNSKSAQEVFEARQPR